MQVGTRSRPVVRSSRSAVAIIERHAFPVADVRRANDRATRLAVLNYGDVPEDLTLDPTPALASFGCLRVKPGWKLRAYLSGGLNSESRVVALPENYAAAADELLLPFSCVGADDRPYAKGQFDDEIDVPRESRRRFMTVVEGDGTPWSYLCASLAVRQLLDFAAFWHAHYAHDWFEHRVVARWPPVVPRPAGSDAQTALKLARPRVMVAAGSVTVTFHTYRPPTALWESLWLHEDRYVTGSCDPVLTRTLVAMGRRREYHL